MKPACTDAEFLALFKERGAAGTAAALGVSERNVYARRRRVEARIDAPIASPNTAVAERHYPARLPLEIQDGVVIVGSDAHYWPGEASTAHRAFVKLAHELAPAAVILDGDVFDGARISRHPPLGWEQKPSVKQELEAVEQRLGEIRAAAGAAGIYWCMGNHDQRFENKLAAQAGDFEGVAGFSLKDHFPFWKFALSIWVNDSVVIKHRFKGGVHATHNNTLAAGKSMVTGHLHSLKVTPYDDYNGTRFGVDTGTLADPYGEQFSYSEDNPLNHRSGFVVLTFSGGRLLWPEIVAVVDRNAVQFRGKIIDV